MTVPPFVLRKCKFKHDSVKINHCNPFSSQNTSTVRHHPSAEPLGSKHISHRKGRELNRFSSIFFFALYFAEIASLEGNAPFNSQHLEDIRGDGWLWMSILMPSGEFLLNLSSRLSPRLLGFGPCLSPCPLSLGPCLSPCLPSLSSCRPNLTGPASGSEDVASGSASGSEDLPQDLHQDLRICLGIFLRI